MKTIIKTIAITVCALLITSLAACGGSNKATETTAPETAPATEAATSAATTTTSTAEATAEATSSATEGTTVEPTTQSVSPLVGSWTYEEKDFPCTYTFNADGTGTYDIFGETMEFTYTDNGGTFSYTMDGAPGSNEYRIEGSKLIITDDLGEDVVYIKN